MREELINLAYDFWWTGDPWAHDVWNELDPYLWDRLNHNPIALLNEADVENASDEWKQKASALLQRYQQYQEQPAQHTSPKMISAMQASCSARIINILIRHGCTCGMLVQPNLNSGTLC